MFKLAYYAATEGRFNEAEFLLNQVLFAILKGKGVEIDEQGEYSDWPVLSQKEIQYVFKTYILLAKIAINSNREYSAKAFVGKACRAAAYFEDADQVQQSATVLEFRNFQRYHQISEPVWAMWKILEPWSESIIQDNNVRQIVRKRLTYWE